VIDSLRKSLIDKLGEENLDRVRAVKVGIAGAGGLGSNLASCLVRTGFRRFRIVDFDIVEPSDLDRQFYFADQTGMPKVDALVQNLLRISTDLDIEVESKKIEKTMFGRFFEGCDIVAECLDQAEYKCALVSDLVALGAYVVAVSGLGGYGSSDEIRVHKMLENLIIVGDLESDVGAKPPLSPRVSIAAAKQADVILDHVLHHCR
jgi:sulfur carrier protein ThiS adenylyltransferase